MVALVGILVVVGVSVFALLRDDPNPPASEPTRPTTTTLALDAVEAAIAESLRTQLTDAQLTATEASCVARALLEVFTPEELQAMERLVEPVTALSDGQRDQVVRGIVRCVTPPTAAALLGDASTTTAPAPGLPDEGA